jgi:CheY-like chemotaxis protein
MIRVLAVDDDEEWRSLITDALPECRVDAAATYREALDLLHRGIPYDVAIVDLNLVSRKNERILDQLGGRLLGRLQKEYPATPRIVLTGEPPGAVRGLIEKYDLFELLLKQSMRLAELGEVVADALARVTGELSPDLRARRGDLWEGFSEWRDSVRRRIDRRLKTLENDLQNAGRDAGRARAADGALEALRVSGAAFESDCGTVAVMIAKIRSEAGLGDAARESAALRDKYKGVF